MEIFDVYPTSFSFLNPSEKGQCFVLVDSNTRALLSQLPFADCPVIEVEAGEQCKCIMNVQRIWQFLLDHQATRDAILINVGGGTITDLGGFTASTYKRGIRFVNLPTSIIGMVDASIGGKTAINFSGVKNNIGTFAQPMHTLICTGFLLTLPVQEWLSGWGEVLKTALLTGEQLWQKVLQYDIETRDIASFTPLLRQCIHTKEAIVAKDPLDHNQRHLLNLGHTVGHALEVMTHSPHGYCVVWGMIAALYLSVTRLGCPRDILTQLTHIMISYYGKPVCSCKNQEQLLELIRQDKKRIDSASLFTLLRQPGQGVINQAVSDNEMIESIDYLMSL